MSLLRMGAGGWAYFSVSGGASLDAYSKAFDFVEVNSTYYELPGVGRVRSWRHKVPDNFEFSVRCNRTLLEQFSPTATNGHEEQKESLLAIMERTCRILRANILSVSLKCSNSGSTATLDMFLSAFHSKGTRVAVELRGSRVPEGAVRVIAKYDAIHSIDVSKEETLLVDSGVLYSRIFGRGEENIYEFDDSELKQIFGTASDPKFEKSILAFHGVRMYRDAARLKVFARTGAFPRLTGDTGFDALEKVLEEDAKFPATGRDLVEKQGWKLFDLTTHYRSKAGTFLQKLPSDQVFSSAINVREALEEIVSSQVGASL